MLFTFLSVLLCFVSNMQRGKHAFLPYASHFSIDAINNHFASRTIPWSCRIAPGEYKREALHFHVWQEMRYLCCNKVIFQGPAERDSWIANGVSCPYTIRFPVKIWTRLTGRAELVEVERRGRISLLTFLF